MIQYQRSGVVSVTPAETHLAGCLICPSANRFGLFVLGALDSILASCTRPAAATEWHVINSSASKRPSLQQASQTSFFLDKPVLAIMTADAAALASPLSWDVYDRVAADAIVVSRT